MIKNSKILITGGYGFIGAYLALLMADANLNNEIVILDINNDSQTTGYDLELNRFSNIEFIKGSILDATTVLSLPKDFDYIIHAAGFLGIYQVAERQLSTMDVNVLGTRNCLELVIQQNKQPHVLLFSTSEIYGRDCSEPDETDLSIIPTTGKRWAYAASKLAAEYYLKAYIQHYDIRGSIIRPFNVFGPYRHGTNAMTSIIERAINNNAITISGDGNQIRSWCYIEDFCKGILSVLIAGKGNGEAYNIGDARNSLTMNQLAKKIVEITNSSSEIVIAHNHTEDIAQRIANTKKAKDNFGYEPTYNFNDAIERVAEWLKKSSTTQKSSKELA